ncbi:hypothetical protein [Luteimonas qiangzhengi]|uniref:hypothetical protein n=1 Tax=Luteimonas sp. MJ146 TaxID=3129240 RepID=UPI0031BBA024
MDERMPTRALARLSPPLGGEQRLRAALHGREAGFGWLLPSAVTFACLCVLAILLALRPDPMDTRIRHAINEAVTPPTGGIRVADVNVERVESLDPAVRIYRLAGEPAAVRSTGG